MSGVIVIGVLSALNGIDPAHLGDIGTCTEREDVEKDSSCKL